MSQYSSFDDSSSSDSLKSPEIPATDFNLSKPTLEKIIDDTTFYKYDTDCLRKHSNWSKNAKSFKFDNIHFREEKLLEKIPTYSSKLDVLIKKIKDLDETDEKNHGHKFKHFIFSDVKSAGFGAKLVAGALIANGMTLAYTAPLTSAGQKAIAEIKHDEEDENDSDEETDSDSDDDHYRGGSDENPPTPKTTRMYGKIEFLDNQVLNLSQGNNFYLLSSLSVYEQPITVSMKKSILKNFNERPTNIYGDHARIIIMDSGFKEGIDLFDIKYIHIFEPQTTMADQKQVIGRGTRTCGQKGLQFHPTQGWPLHVFIYDIDIPETMKQMMLGASSAFELYLNALGIDLRLFTFQSDLERATILGSVDYELNQAIHSFSATGKETPVRTAKWVSPSMMFDYDEDTTSHSGGAKILVRKDLPVINLGDVIPGRAIDFDNARFNHASMRQYIRENFSQYAWKDVKMENLCLQSGGKSGDQQQGGKSELLQYSPSQDFIRHYFTPAVPVKGMLLHHSTGSGKTCSAIAAATSSFEKQGYTILWVTRTTLKNDIWKNMFDQICHDGLREQFTNGTVIPEEQSKRMRLLSKSWSIRPMSYKQFSNMVSKQNAFYHALVKKNGEADPLQKTLLIIDEAHKLYGGGDLSTIERPDMQAFQQAVQNSFVVSGNNSVRLLLMTATPITENPMELIKIINLCKPMETQMPTHFDDFSKEYLDESGHFTPQGEVKYLDAIAGHVSYLNREKDARQFAQPIIHIVKTPIIQNEDDLERFDNKYVRLLADSDVANLKAQIDAQNKTIDAELQELDKSKFSFLHEKCANYEDKQATQCKKIVNANIRDIIKEAKASVQSVKDNIKDLREKIKERKYAKQKKVAETQDFLNEHPRDYEEFKRTMYYQLKKCGKRVKNMTDLKEAVKTHPIIVQMDQEIAIHDEKIEELQDHLKTNLESYKNRIKQLRELAKSDLSELESNVIRLVLKDERKTLKKRASSHTSTTKVLVNEHNETKKAIQKKKDEKIKKIRKTLKVQLTEIQRAEKETAKAEKNLRKTQRKQGVLIEKIENELIQDLVAKYSKLIDDDLESMKEDLVYVENEKRAKAAAKEAAKQQKEAAKEGAKKEKEEAAKQKARAKHAAALEKSVAAKAAALEKRETKKRLQELKNAEKAARKTMKKHK
jgi:hypothetical protein